MAIRIDPRARLIFLVCAALSAVITVFGACGACGRGTPQASSPASASAPRSPPSASVAPPPPARDLAMWSHVKEGEVEDLMTLAAHEGALGLVEAAGEAELRPTAIRAMAFARGFAQLPFLARAAQGVSNEEALLALESTIELARRPLHSEDMEDGEELEGGCAGLVALAKDETRSRDRRVLALRALRMMPCPPAELPTDLDAR